MSHTAKKMMKNQDTALGIIPSGITSVLQPLDFGTTGIKRDHTLSHPWDFAGNPLYLQFANGFLMPGLHWIPASS